MRYVRPIHVCWFIILTGIVLRLVRYLYNPSLWSDESVMAEDIIMRSFPDLFQPSPDWSSKHPVGFLMLVKLAVVTFGNSEYALRIVPLLAGIASLLLFCKVAQNHIRSEVIPIALGLFAIMDPLVFQSSNIKPYSGDISIALIILLGVHYLQSTNLRTWHIIFFGFVGAAMIWFSNTSVFVFSGTGLSLTMLYLKRKEWDRLWKTIFTFSIIAASFIVYYFTYVQNLIESTGFSVDQIVQFEKAFIPFPPRTLSDIRLIIESFFDIFKFPLGFTLYGLAAFCFLIGCISIFRRNRDNFILILSPILITLFASFLHRYAFTGRLIIFLVPFFLLFISEGAVYVSEKISVTSVAPGIIFLGLLFFYPLSWASYHAVKPSSHEEIRPVIGYIQDNMKKGDIVYVYYYAQYPFGYYTKFHPERFDFGDVTTVIGIAPRGWYRSWRKQDVSRYYSPNDPVLQSDSEILTAYVKDLNKLKGNRRVWILFTSKIYKDDIPEEKFFLLHLDKIGKRLDFFGRSGISSVYLYDLSGV